MKRIFKLSVFIAIVGIVANSCQKDPDLPPNPYDLLITPDDTSTVIEIDPNSIVGIHKNVFVPTCANSGCHDGTFEPDFRTVESAYNTMIYHPIVKNDTLGTYTYRVVPGSLNESVLWNRLTVDIDGQSGVMPIVIDTLSDWLTMKDDYMENIRTWILNGAPDMFGNSSNIPNQKPYCIGALGFFSNQTTFPFETTAKGSIEIPQGTGGNIDLWFSIHDDSTNAGALGVKEIKYCLSRDNFNIALLTDNLTYQANGITYEDFFGNLVTYNYKVSVDIDNLGGGFDGRLFFRVYVKDPQHDATEIPTYGSADHIKLYFSLVKPQ